jgi:hypothetical protein
MEDGDNQIRPHSSLRYKPPAPEAMLPWDQNPLVEKLTLEVVQWYNRRGQVNQNNNKFK